MLKSKIRVLHIITGLETGGAEMMLYKVLKSGDNDCVESSVISLTDIGPVGHKIKDLGIEVFSLNMKRGIPNPLFLFRLSRLVKRVDPDVIQTWMYHADLLVGLASVFFRNIPIVWGVRQSDLDVSGSKKLTIYTAKLCALLSGYLPKSILCCSEASKYAHLNIGYSKQKITVIPNGFELDVFAPNPIRYEEFRLDNELDVNSTVVGLVGRFHPQKDHKNFIEAAKILSEKYNNVYFYLCGDNVNWENEQLEEWITASGLKKYFILAGRKNNIQDILPGFDIHVSSSSFGEGFPNVIGESMAAGVPCVVTDVGDSAIIVDRYGKVVPPRSPSKMADALSELIDMKGEGLKSLGEKARERINENYRLDVIVKKYENLYWQMVKTCAE